MTCACHTRFTRGLADRGVAVEAVRLVCDIIRTYQIGKRAAIHVEPEKLRSVRVAEKSGFGYVRDFPSAKNKEADGSPITYSLCLLDL